MATRERGSTGPPFGIAHLTVVPENFDPEWGNRDDGSAADELPTDDGETGGMRAMGGRGG